MKIKYRNALLSLSLASSILLNAFASAGAAKAQSPDEGRADVFDSLLREARGPEFAVLLERVLGGEAAGALDALVDDRGGVFRDADAALEEKLGQRFADRVRSLRKGARAKEVSGFRRLAPGARPRIDWRALAFGFQPLPQGPQVQVNETKTQVSASGSASKEFEGENGTVKRTNKVETKAIDDGRTVGVEYKTTEVIDARSKIADKSFRKETTVSWRVEVAACPDAQGVVAGTATESVNSRNLINEGGASTLVSRDVSIQMRLTGHVNDDAEMTHYDMEGDVTETASGFGEAAGRGLIKDAAQKDGARRVSYLFRNNFAGTNDSTDQGIVRTPPKAGTVAVKAGPNTSAEDARQLDQSAGKLIGAVWNEANNSFQRARSNWRNYGCVEVVCRAPKSKLKPGEEVEVAAESTHKHDSGPVAGLLKASGTESITPEEQRGARASFVLTGLAEGSNPSSITVESISKRGIGIGGLDFAMEKEESEETLCAAGWTGVVTAERKRREEREKRSGDNLAENGGYLESTAKVQLRLGGRRVGSSEGDGAFEGVANTLQQQLDFEYDKYHVDEGYCGPSATPYKAPLEKTRTSKTAATYNGALRYVLSVGGGSGSITFTLPEMMASTVHSYTHKSACSYNDRANTNQATDEGVTVGGGSYSFSFPIAPGRQSLNGSITVREEDGSTTTYTWQLVPCQNTRRPPTGRK
jgi:hypothetical protein